MAINEKGFGSIYGSTWWGSGSAFTNSVGWGSAMFYLLDPADLRNRAEKDGGYIEAFECVSKKLRTYPKRDEGRTLFESYDLRCETDGGDAEARVCTINELNDLL